MSKLEIYVNNEGGISIAHARSDSRPPLVVDIDKEEFFSGGMDAAASKLGRAVVHILNIWHPELFLVSDITIPNSHRSEDLTLILELVAKSVQDQTKSHLSSIEYLLNRSSANAADPNKAEFLSRDWPAIKSRIQTFAA